METQAENKASSQQTKLDEILEKIKEITQKTAHGDYIYRGESKSHKKVCSSLYREYPHMEEVYFDIEGLQDSILEEVRTYIGKTDDIDATDDIEILTELQHFGGKTNLIDFTEDYLIALFFACDGSHEEDGRVILLKRKSDDYAIREPRRTINRVESQKSVFVESPTGFVEPDSVVTIPMDLKFPMLNYLEKYHRISIATIYNDLHGFIRRSVYMELLKGLTNQRKVDEAKTPEEKDEYYKNAIRHYTEVIKLKPDFSSAYNNRGSAYHDIGDFGAALADFDKAIELDPENAGFYSNRGNAYANQGDFGAALADLNKVVDLAPKNSGAYNVRGVAYAGQSNFEAAIEDFDKAVDLDPKEAGVKGKYMKNQRFNRNIFGDLPTQKMAQEALPILVSHAQKGAVITLQELAKEIAPHLTQFNWSMRWTLAWIHTTLYELEQSDEWKYGEIPSIAAIAVDKPRKPTNWMDRETRINPNTPLPWEDYKTDHVLPVFEYPHWDKVMDFVFGS